MANQAYPVSENFMLYPMETTLRLAGALGATEVGADA